MHLTPHLTSFFILCGRLEYKILNIIFIRKRIWFLHVRLSIECFLEVKPDHLDLGPVEDPVQGGEEKISEDPIHILTQPARNLITYQPWEKIINTFFCVYVCLPFFCLHHVSIHKPAALQHHGVKSHLVGHEGW